MNKRYISLCFLVFSMTLEADPGEELQFVLEDGGTVSEVIWNRINPNHEDYPGFYGRQGIILMVLAYNNLNLEKAIQLTQGEIIKIPPFLKKFFLIKKPEQKKLSATNNHPIETHEKKPFYLLAGTYFFNKSVSKKASGRTNTQRNIQPIIGFGKSFVLGSDYHWENRIFLTKLEDAFEYSYEGRVRRKYFFFKLDYEKYYFYSGTINDPFLSSMNGLYPGIGAEAALRNFHMSLSFAKAVSTKARYENQTTSLNGQKIHSRIGYHLNKKLSLEFHFQQYGLKRSNSLLNTTRYFGLLKYNLDM
jgi:hypothetical protein